MSGGVDSSVAAALLVEQGYDVVGVTLRLTRWDDAADGVRGSEAAAPRTPRETRGRLIGYAPHEALPPSDRDLADAARVIAAQSLTSPFLAFLRDKSLLFNEARTAFVMYAVKGRTWVALGDPVGPDDQSSDLIRQFLERCDDFGGVPVFYEIDKARLHLYADFGLVFVKLGEAATVDLSRFTLEGGQASKHRQALRRLEKDGASFRVLEPHEVVAVIGQLRQVSDAWLAAKSTAEKGFSLGFFDDGIRVAISGRGDRACGTDRGVCKYLVRRQPRTKCLSI